MTSRLYDSARWKRLRRLVLTSEPMCRMCAEIGKATLASVADHVTPIAAGGDPWSLDNLQPLCAPCHDGAKAEQESTGRIRGCDEHGVPLDPAHPWRRSG